MKNCPSCKQPIPKNMAFGGLDNEPNSSSINDTQDSAPPVTTSPGNEGEINVLTGLPLTDPVTGSQIGAKPNYNGEGISDYQSPPTNYNIPQNDAISSMASVPQGISGPGALAQFQAGIQQQYKGIGEGEQAAGTEGAIRSAANQYYQNSSDAAQHDANFHLQQLQQENDALVKDYKNGHIDPNHLFENMAVPGKISTAIGLILGGIGSGLTHQQNPALAFLNSQIDRDIQAQQANLGKYPTLLEANIRRMGDVRSGLQMTQAQLKNIYASQIDDATAKTSDVRAKSLGDQASGQLKSDSALKTQGLAVQQALMSQMRSSQPGSTDQFLNILDVQNPELAKNMRSRYVPGSGFASTPLDEKTRESMTKYDQLDSQLEDAINFAKKTGTTVPFSTNDAIADEKRNNIILSMNDLHGLNRLNDNEFETYKNQVPNPGAIRSQKAIAQLQEIRNAIQQRKSADLQSIGLKPPGQVSPRITNYRKAG